MTNNRLPVSVLMSVYQKEMPEYLEQSLKSIFSQSQLPDEILLVEDGPLTDLLYTAIELLQLKAQEQGIAMNCLRLQQNRGLGIALKEGMKACRNELIARMDSDDIACDDRLEKQYAFMLAHPDVSACGGYIEEFSEDSLQRTVKKMPLDEQAVRNYAKYRNPLNHMTVMFRRKDIEEVGGYRDVKQLEDYDLWIRMLANHKIIMNLPEVLVQARTGNQFAQRRGGEEYFKRYKSLRKMQKDTGLLNNGEYCIAVCATFLMTRSGNGLRKLLYRELRK